MIHKAIRAKNICRQLNYDWESILNHAKQTANLDDETMPYLLNLAMLMGVLSEFKLAQEDLDFAIDVWTSCQIHDVTEKALEIAWLATLQPYLDAAVTDEELSQYISELPEKIKDDFNKEMEKAESTYIHTLKFELMLDNLVQYGFSSNDLSAAMRIWNNSIAFDIDPTTCANIALYWLKNKYPT